jgi:hypothetical protein
MEFIVVLDPSSPAARANAVPDSLPWYLAAVDDKPLTVCTTLRCAYLDASQPQFLRCALTPNEFGESHFVWVPVSAVVTIFEQNPARKATMGFAPDTIQ